MLDPKPARIAEVVAEVFETSPEEIRSSHGTIERRVVAWLGCYEGQARLGAIGTLLRLRSTSRVSELIAERMNFGVRPSTRGQGLLLRGVGPYLRVEGTMQARTGP